MHASIAEIICGEHQPAFSRSGLLLEKFAELDTPKRHAIAFTVSVSNGRRTNAESKYAISEINICGDSISLKKILQGEHRELVSLFQNLVEPNLWARKAYRSLSRIIKDKEVLKILRHQPNLRLSTVHIVAALPSVLRSTTMVNLCATQEDASYVSELFKETAQIVPAEHHQGLIASLVASTSLGDLAERCRSKIFKCAIVSDSLPEATNHFRRIRTLSDCHRVAQYGHCFNEDFMLEEVFKGNLAFYEWSGAKNAIVELQREQFPFGWSVTNAMKPKSAPLTRLQQKQLNIDLAELGTQVRRSSLSRRFENMFSRLS